MSTIVNCRSCGARIVFLPTAKGATMPVDAADVAAADREFDAKRHVSHFATCPHAASHRRRDAARAAQPEVAPPSTPAHLPAGGSAAASYKPLAMWTVYDHPKDHPDVFVARRFELQDGTMTPTGAVQQHQDLAQLRLDMRASGLFCLKRAPSDDPVIVEVWL